ncbi:MAG: 4-hydroxythreonine-4-phosphate dehydrogenase PdxA [Chthoniobacterales bacterium]|nr:4-hydroxythreonine-4-phosphate dehydrogenase PdxA [Chthoniobacterales bacterium]
MSSHLIGLTAGDLSGIGPEIVTKTISHFERHPEELEGGTLTMIGESQARYPGHPDAESSQAAIASLEEAAAKALKGELAAIVTGPVSKHQLHQVGFPFPGQTEFFAARAGVSNYAMLLTGGRLTVALVTAHLPLNQVARALRSDEIVRVGNLLLAFLQRRKIASPRVAVLGLNPHAGEQGDLGEEEEKIITPAITRLRQDHPGMLIAGPSSPDTVFWHALQGAYDGLLCMYHDQGLIPLKLHAFEEGVNVTLGLPFLRMSPDHGTAYDLAGKGVASAQSMIAAVRLAAKMVVNN